MEVEEALARSPRMAVLGDPGAGKTTLLKYLALRVAQGDPGLARVILRRGRMRRTALLPVPLFLTLNNLARDGHSLEGGMLDELAQRGFPHARLFLERALAQGRCLCLLDGLDEVADDESHDRLIREINGLAAAPGNHLVVTSRIVGYRYHLKDEFDLLEVVEFDREQICRFLQRWFERQPGSAEGLLAALADSPGMRLLAANPLLLSIIALIYERDTQLSERRVELYNRCVWMLVKEWDRVRDVPGERRFAPDATRRWLAALALCFQQRGRTTVMDEDLLLGHLAEILPQADQARPFLDEVMARTGLLRQMSQTSYAFAHLTIQEYLVAEAIRQGVRVVDGAVVPGDAYSPYEDGLVRLLERLGPEHPRYADALIFEQRLRENIAQARKHGDSADRRAERAAVVEQLNRLALAAMGTPFNQLCHLSALAGEGPDGTHTLVLAHLEDSWWRETIILLAGLERDATALIRDILDTCPDSMEVLLLAVRCLVDADETDPALRTELVGRLLAYLKQTDDYRLVQGVEDLADALGEAGWGELTGMLQDPDPAVRVRIAGLLGAIGAERGVPALLEAALRDEDSAVRAAAGRALGEIDGEVVVGSLLKVLRDPESDFRVPAADALARIDAGVLVNLLRDSAEPDAVRGLAADALARVDAAVLVNLLRDSAEPDAVRGLAADALGRDDKACKLLPPLLGDSEKDATTRRLASEALCFAFVLVPAGEFLMGSTDGDKEARCDEYPQHRVHLQDYYITRYPVTEAQYQRFVVATRREALEYWKDGHPPEGREGHPVARVSWQEAVAYCEWLAEDMGRPIRLPTEAEWEKAARGTDGRIYPWGDVFDREKCNTSGSGIEGTTPVGKYSPAGDSPYGCADMAGNVWGWCTDWYGEGYYARSPAENPTGPASGERRVLRGGSFYADVDGVRCAARDLYSPRYLRYYVGFRCVVAAPCSPGAA